LVGFLCLLTRLVEVERRQRLLGRFKGRDRVPYQYKIRSVVPTERIVEAEKGWLAVCEIIKDPNLLSPDDRIDVIPSRDSGFPLEYELHDLNDAIESAQIETDLYEKLDTVLDVAMLLGTDKRGRNRQTGKHLNSRMGRN